MKFCSKCGKDKPLEEFHNHKRTKDGKYYACKECKREQDRKSHIKHKDKRNAKAIKYYEDNKESFKEYRKKYYRENKEFIAESNKKWREANPEKMDEYRASYRERNREALREADRIYRSNTLDKARLRSSRRRARLRSLPDTLTEDEIEVILGIFVGRCSICEGPFEHLDHFIPVSSGHGGTTKENIVPMCAECNIAKGAKNPFEWAKTLTQKDRERFDSLVEYLTELNGIAAVEDYEAHVYQCFN